jgi:hypothetical protein
MFDPLDILLGILALLAIVAATTALFSPFIAYLWYQRSELRAKAEDLPGFPVIDPHPVDSTPGVSDAPRADNPVHVYPLREFLAEPSDAASVRSQIVADCRTYLAPIPTVKNLWTGQPANTPRSVVDNSYDVGLCVIFDDVAAHDVYQSHPLHQQFIERNQK